MHLSSRISRVLRAAAFLALVLLAPLSAVFALVVVTAGCALFVAMIPVYLAAAILVQVIIYIRFTWNCFFRQLCGRAGTFIIVGLSLFSTIWLGRLYFTEVSIWIA